MRAASFKSLYQKRPGPSSHRTPPLSCRGAYDTALRLVGSSRSASRIHSRSIPSAYPSQTLRVGVGTYQLRRVCFANLLNPA